MDPIAIQRIDAFHNLIITFAYLGIGIFIAPRMYFARRINQSATIAKWSAIIFLISCSVTHAEMAYHGITSTPYIAGEVFHIFIAIVQAWSASTFLIFATLFIEVRIGFYRKSEPKK